MPSHRQLAAILFTDIVGFTAMMQRSEEQAVTTVKHHRQILEASVSERGGEVLEYFGDGSLCIFNNVSDAVHCAVRMQQRCRKDPKVPLRIGLHTGEVLFEEGSALGDSINIASRIESIAAEGSVFLSEKIAREIENKGDFRLKDLGHFQFKNVFHSVKLYAVVAEGLYVPRREELGSSMETDKKFQLLPHYLTPFIGRAHQIKAITSLILRENKRLITLLGPGGMGKTRLSVKVAELLVDELEHGVCFVPLDVVTDHEQVPLYISHRLGLKERFNHSWAETIIEFLADKQLLLVLDNLEQILATKDFIARLLDACPKLKILATSREVLGLPQEVEYPLDSLNRPNPRLFPSPKELVRFDAIDLFVQKARASMPAFRLNEDNALAVVEICQELEGLPLPIELAAARVKLFSPDLLLRKLRKNSDLLKTKSTAVVARHQTIRNTVQWSYDLLNAEEQQLFQQLSLFSGGFTAEALEAVCPDHDSLDVIESFFNKSLLVKGEEVYDSPRFRMLKLIRDYGREQLDGNSEKNTYYRRFAQYYLDFLEKGEAKLRSPEQARWMAWMEAEYENIWIALEWLLENDTSGACCLGARFWRFFLTHGFLREGLDMLKTLLSTSVPEKSMQAKLLEGAGVLSHNMGDNLAARAYFRQCLDIWEALQDDTEIIKALNNTAWGEWRIGNYDQTVSYSEKALQLAEAINHQHERAKSLNNLAWIHLSRGLNEKAEALQREVLLVHQQNNNARGVAFAKANLGWSLLQTGKLIEAEQLITEAIRQFDALKDRQLLAFSRLIKSDYYLEINDWPAARELLLQNTLPEFEKIGDIWGVATSHQRLGKNSLRDNDFLAAKFHLAKAFELFQHSHDKFGQANTELELSRLYWELGQTAAATESLERCLKQAAQMDANQLLMKGHQETAHRDYERQSYESALKSLAIAGYYAEKQGSYRRRQFEEEIQPYLTSIREALGTNKELSHQTSGVSQEAFSAIPIGETELQSRIQRLLSPKNRKSAGNQPHKKSVSGATGSDPFLRKAQQIIEAHLQNPDFSVQDLCRELAVSHSQLHRRLTERTGLSASKFIRSIRLQKATELLRNPDLTVTAIAYDTGFKDPDYFYRVFKKEFGMTPGEFRQEQSRD